MIELKKPYEETIGIDKLCLDQQNYRIDFIKYNTDPELIERLYVEEGVIEIMKDIVSFPGLFPNEKLIVVPNDDHTTYTVKEGNRRLLAIQSLLNMAEPPSEYKSKVFELALKLDEETKESLKHIGCVVYDPNDDTVNRIIVHKHSTTGHKKWGQIGQWHKDKDLYDQYKKNIDKAAEQLGIPKQNLSSYIRYYNLITYIRKLPFWAEHNLTGKIDNNNLQATRFTRLIDSPDIKNALRLDYDETLEVKPPDEDIELFNFLLCKYIMATLIDNTINTRKDKGKVITCIEQWKKEYYPFLGDEQKNGDDQSQNKDKNTSSSFTKDTGKEKTEDTPNNKQAKKNPDKYFESLTCYVDNQHLSRLTIELRELSTYDRIHKFPLAAAMLTRAILESSLKYQIKKRNKYKEYRSTYKEHIYSRDQLNKLIKYVKDNAKSLFDEYTASKAENALNLFSSHTGLTYLNSLVHEDWIDPVEDYIHNIAGDIRELLQAILSDTA